jgi:hypothetical protein
LLESLRSFAMTSFDYGGAFLELRHHEEA